MTIETPKPDKFVGYGDVSVIETTLRSIQLHVPAQVRDDMGLRRGQRMHIEVNLHRNQILYTLLPPKKKAASDDS